MSLITSMAISVFRLPPDDTRRLFVTHIDLEQ
jgi:hypothetical protein